MSTEQRDPGAPIARGEIDPELVKIARPRLNVGVITAAGLVFLGIMHLLRIEPDRRFAGNGSQPRPAAIADLLAGKVALDQLITVTAEPLVSHAIRITKNKADPGHRLVPARGTGDRLWLVIPGDGWGPPTLTSYTGRLRKLDDLALAASAHAYADAHPRPVFAQAAAVRAGFSTGWITSVAGDRVAVADGDAIALDVVDPNTATIAASFNDRRPDTTAWRTALERAGIAPTATAAPDTSLGQVRFTVALPVATTTTRLQSAALWAARVEPVTRHYQTTWATLRRSPPAGLDVGRATLPDEQIDSIGLYVARGIPHDAYALITDQSPDEFWYIMPIAVALVVIVLVFAWALVRAVRRDLLPSRAA